MGKEIKAVTVLDIIKAARTAAEVRGQFGEARELLAAAGDALAAGATAGTVTPVTVMITEKLIARLRGEWAGK
jgi:hypothetical protein